MSSVAWWVSGPITTCAVARATWSRIGAQPLALYDSHRNGGAPPAARCSRTRRAVSMGAADAALAVDRHARSRSGASEHRATGRLVVGPCLLLVHLARGGLGAVGPGACRGAECEELLLEGRAAASRGAEDLRQHREVRELRVEVLGRHFGAFLAEALLPTLRRVAKGRLGRGG